MTDELDRQLDLTLELPDLPSLNTRIEAAIAALDPQAQGAVFLLGERQDDGSVIGKVAVVHKIADGWTLDLEAHVAKKGGSDWQGPKWTHGASVLVRGVW